MRKSNHVFDEDGICYCGSNKKYKICCKKRKPLPYAVIPSIEIDPIIDLHSIEGKAELTFYVNEKKEFIAFEDMITNEITEIKFSSVVYHSQKQNRKSILAMIPCKLRSVGFGDNIYSILDDFDRIFGLDTNFNIHEQLSFSKTCELLTLPSSQSVSYQFIPNEIEFFAKGRQVTDREAVYYLIQMLKELIPEFDSKKVGIVIDSDLNLIKDISLCRIALFEDYFLPNNVTLIYARDRPAATPLNGLIKDCDKQANLRIADYLSGTFEFNPLFFKDLTHKIDS
jgi:hypothetical protein